MNTIAPGLRRCSVRFLVTAILSAMAMRGLATPTIEFTHVPAWGSFSNLEGRVSGVDPTDCMVSVCIYVEGWWTKPYQTFPLTTIMEDGSWTCDITTGGNDQDATRIIAFLVPQGYTPPFMEGQAAIPQEVYDTALDFAYVEREPRYRSIQFSGMTWDVKASMSVLGPGPNYFSDSTNDVWVDASGALHLRIAYHDDRWNCTEIIASNSLGYGTYVFHLGGGLSNLDKNMVVGLFTWDTTAPQFNYREIDIEFSRWGVGGDPNAQYVVQPWSAAGNRFRFDLAEDRESTHHFTWRSNSVSFGSCYGWTRTPAEPDAVTNWAYTGNSVPPCGDEHPRINFWLMHGLPPSAGQGGEIVVDRVEFVPLVTEIGGLGIRAGPAIGWPSVSGAIYQVQQSDSLSSGTWNDHGNPTLGTGITNWMLDTTEGVPRRFYRVVAVE
jgi:hypothetical protein